jgi:hypothetical protein
MLDIALSVQVGAFRTGIDHATIHFEDFQRFRMLLEQVYRFEPVEAFVQSEWDGFSARVRMSDRGRLAIEGDTWTGGPDGEWDGAKGNSSHFEVDGLDQSFLPEAILSLQAIEDAFPPLGG